MADYGNGTYEVEVWHKSSSVPLGNIRHLCQNLRWTRQRNQAETLSFTIDLSEYEKYIEKIGMLSNPFQFLDVGSCDIRIKRNGVYLLGANVTKLTYSPNDPSVTMSVSCNGYLNYFKTAYTDMAYSQVAQGDMMFDVIDTYQLKTGADYGITDGGHYGGNTILRDRNFTRKNIKDFLQQLSNVIGGCDFEFTADKQFKTYGAIGSYRPDIRLIYPDNIKSFSFDRSVDSVYNYIYGIGSGNGEDAIYVTAFDSASASELYRREKISTFNSVVEESTLTENTNGVLNLTKDIRELPSITLPDDVLDLNDVGIGDTIYLKLGVYQSLGHIDGYYRIEKIDCSVDNNDSETVSLTFDDLDVDSIITEQES